MLPESSELEALRAIVKGTARETGEAFFQALVASLAQAVGVEFAFIAEFVEGRSKVRTRAFWARDRIVSNVEYDLAGTPCQDVLTGKICHHPREIQRRFPDDQALVQLHIESYLGVPLRDGNGNVLGHLAVFDGKPMPAEPRSACLIEIFASRAAAELERLAIERTLADSEQRFRDLFEKAPIAYVLEDDEGRIVEANQAALELLGLATSDHEGVADLSVTAMSPASGAGDAPPLSLQAALRERAQQQGCGLPEMEFRRRDDGRPVWIQGWSRPEPHGRYARIMLLDVTARVLAEQERARLEEDNRYLREEIKAENDFEEIIGRSPALAHVLQEVHAVGPTEASVLIQGETGTGKELVARALHSVSPRNDKPLIKVNCAALPITLVESELFGHEKGAFTGALARRVGRFELAHRGTLFLDEVGELPLEVQAKLLRVLQERELERLGGTQVIRVDVRVIAATNRDLVQAIRRGEFREDLFYRLNVFPLEIPPLRERVGDVPLLAYYYASRSCSRLGKAFDGIHPATMERLVAYRWPGNVRELENVMERAAILHRGGMLEINADQLHGVLERRSSEMPTPAPPSWPPAVAPGPSSAALEVVERHHLLAVLESTQWRIEGEKGAARILGLHPNTLRSRLKKLGIHRPE